MGEMPLPSSVNHSPLLHRQIEWFFRFAFAHSKSVIVRILYQQTAQTDDHQRNKHRLNRKTEPTV